MNILLIDIGNSRIKSSLSVNGKMTKPIFLVYIKNKFEKHIRFLLNKYKGQFTEIYISSIDKEYITAIRKLLPNHKVNYISKKMFLPIKIEYAASLGSDRISSSVGAFTKFNDRKNILIIDMGTATTFNIISNGVYKGGMISAGLVSAMEVLYKKTTLPKVVLNNDVKILSKTTNSAIISGLVFQQVFFIEKVIEKYKNIFKNLYVIITGGASEILSKKIKGVNKIVPNLVLEGLNYIAIYNQRIN